MKTRNKQLVDDTRWKTKGGPHATIQDIPEVCTVCGGKGFFTGKSDTSSITQCDMCQGTGESHPGDRHG